MIIAASHVRWLIDYQVVQLREIQLIGFRLLDEPNDGFITLQLQSGLNWINATWVEAKTTNIYLLGRKLDTMEPYIDEDCFGRIYSVYEEMRERTWNSDPY
jgi:hypothetical protein